MTTSPHMANITMRSELRQAMFAESERLEEDALYSARGHFEAARTWGRAHLSLGIPTSLLAALAGVSAFNNHPLIAGAAAIIVAALSSVSTFLNPSEKAQTYHLAGTGFNTVRSRARMFRQVRLLTTISDEALASELEQLVARKNDLNEKSPIIPRPAFERARKGIESGEAAYAVDSKALNP